MLRTLSISLSLVLVSACNTTLTNDQQQYVDNLSPCEKLNGLLDSYNDGFEVLKAYKIDNKYTNIWQPKYHLLNNSCQIIGLDNSKARYQCTEQFDQPDLSINRYEWASQQIEMCLGKQWLKQEFNKDDMGKRIYSNGSVNANITVSYGKTLSKFSGQWQTTFELGGPLKELNVRSQ